MSDKRLPGRRGDDKPFLIEERVIPDRSPDLPLERPGFAGKKVTGDGKPDRMRKTQKRSQEFFKVLSEGADRS